jgi:hypothetical protein
MEWGADEDAAGHEDSKEGDAEQRGGTGSGQGNRGPRSGAWVAYSGEPNRGRVEGAWRKAERNVTREADHGAGRVGKQQTELAGSRRTLGSGKPAATTVMALKAALSATRITATHGPLGQTRACALTD